MRGWRVRRKKEQNKKQKTILHRLIKIKGSGNYSLCLLNGCIETGNGRISAAISPRGSLCRRQPTRRGFAAAGDKPTADPSGSFYLLPTLRAVFRRRPPPVRQLMRSIGEFGRATADLHGDSVGQQSTRCCISGSSPVRLVCADSRRTRL